MSEFTHQTGISYKINQDLPYGVLFLSLTQRSDLPSCSYPPNINHLSWITKGTRWVILADSEKSITAQQKPTQWLGATSNQPISVSPTQKTTLIFPDSLVLQTELFWFHTFQRLLKIQGKQMTMAACRHRSFEKCLNSQHPNFEFLAFHHTETYNTLCF